MEYKEFKNIVKDMEESNLSELSIEFPDGTKISLKKDNVVKSVPVQNIAPSVENTITVNEKAQEEKDKEDCKIVKSPMVGTFYSKTFSNS